MTNTMEPIYVGIDLKLETQYEHQFVSAFGREFSGALKI